MRFIKIEEASKLLNVTDTTLKRWVRQGVITTYKISNENLIEKKELLKWAEKSKIKVQEAFLEGDELVAEDNFDENSIVTKALKNGVFKRISTKLTRNEVYKKAIELTIFQNNLNLDKNKLLGKFLERETDLPTIIGNSVAIPHPKRSHECKFKKSIISIFILDHPITLNEDENNSADLLFFLFSKDSMSHLKLLSKIAKLISMRKDFKNQIVENKNITKDELLQLINKEEIELK